MIERIRYLTETDKRRYTEACIRAFRRKNDVGQEEAIFMIRTEIDLMYEGRRIEAFGEEEEKRKSFNRMFGNHRPNVTEYFLWLAQSEQHSDLVSIPYSRKAADQPARKGKAGLRYAVIFMNHMSRRFVVAVEDKIRTPFVSLREKDGVDRDVDLSYTFYDQALTGRQAEVILNAAKDRNYRQAREILYEYFRKEDTYLDESCQDQKFCSIITMIPPKWRGAWHDELEDVVLNGKRPGYYETVIINR